MGRLHITSATVGALSFGLAVGLAHAGSSAGASGGTSSGGCGCIPTTHQVRVPGIDVSPPSVTVNIPTINYDTATANASSNASASASTNVSVSTTSTGGVNTQAILNENNSGAFGGGGGSWSDSGGVTTTIDTVKVETPTLPETRRICAAFQAAVKMVAIQANCLDDKDVPHPASQLAPNREIADGYEGEVYRCIAGARMQYTIADYAGQAVFDHGQTLTCQKGEALYHTAAGALQCRPQKPARDCNERSLLRRFGAGVKIVKVSQTNVCSAWRTEIVQASAAID